MLATVVSGDVEVTVDSGVVELTSGVVKEVVV